MAQFIREILICFKYYISGSKKIRIFIHCVSMVVYKNIHSGCVRVKNGFRERPKKYTLTIIIITEWKYSKEDTTVHNDVTVHG